MRKERPNSSLQQRKRAADMNKTNRLEIQRMTELGKDLHALSLRSSSSQLSERSPDGPVCDCPAASLPSELSSQTLSPLAWHKNIFTSTLTDMTSCLICRQLYSPRTYTTRSSTQLMSARVLSSLPILGGNAGSAGLVDYLLACWST